MAWMTFEQAIHHAQREALMRGYRYRVYKSRSVVGWWNTVETDVRAPAASKRQP